MDNVTINIDTSPAFTNGRGPEKKLTMLVTVMAMLEKTASFLGKLMFVIMTMMLLRAFMIMPQRKDWVFVTFILSFERLRILFNRCELELHQQATCQSFSANNSRSGRLFYWIQLAIHFIYCYRLVSSFTCVVLSAMRLVSHDFNQTEETHSANWDPKILNLFYMVALAQALMLQVEACWICKVSYCGLLEKVCAECGLDKSDVILIKRFFYDTYSKSKSGSIFDTLNIDLAIFAQGLLISSIDHEPLMGARILRILSTRQHSSNSTLCKIRTSNDVIKWLIDNLNNHYEEEIRYSAGVIILKLADKEQNALFVTGIPIESISSLLDSSSKPDGHKYNSRDFNLLGLKLLMKLAKEHENCAKICKTEGLLNKIINFSRDIDSDVVEKSLQVVNMLATTTGKTGKTGLKFRRKISKYVFIGINIRDILQQERPHLQNQRLALKVLTNLAMDRKARMKIGRTGGLVKKLVELFVRLEETCDQNVLRVEAGNALAMLVLENEGICSEILDKRDIVEKLTEDLKDSVLSVSSSRILHNLCASAGPKWSRQLSKVVASFTLVLKAIMDTMEKNERKRERVMLLEVSLGLAAQMLKFMSPCKLIEEIHRALPSVDHLVQRLVMIIADYRDPSIEAPEIRRFAIELIVEIMRIDKKYVKLFKDAGIDRELRCMTTIELDSFNIFSGSVGQSKHQDTLDSLRKEAFELLSE